MSLTAPAPSSRVLRVLERAEIDARLAGLALALAGIGLALHAATDGLFLTPRNLYNLAVQTSVVGVMATGMVLVIVARHIDLSVGSLLGLTGMVVATLQAEVLASTAFGWPLSVACGLLCGAAIGGFQGYWVAYRGVPAFVVTLAGLLMFRGGAFLVTDGRTVAPLDATFQRLGGGVDGSLGALGSWIFGIVALLAIGLAALRGRRERIRHGIPPRPRWADALRVAIAGLAVIVGVLVMNAYTRPQSDVARGIPYPVLVVIAVALSMTAIARFTRFGRYVWALGGNPEAVALAGVNVRRVTLGIFATMGLLAAVAGVLTAARLNAGTNSMGTLAELNVIAAAVLGGTSLSGGIGSIGGALLGALLMQSLDNGMVLLGVSSPLRQVAIGALLIAAVWLDGIWRRRQASA